MHNRTMGRDIATKKLVALKATNMLLTLSVSLRTTGWLLTLPVSPKAILYLLTPPVGYTQTHAREA